MCGSGGITANLTGQDPNNKAQDLAKENEKSIKKE